MHIMYQRSPSTMFHFLLLTFSGFCYLWGQSNPPNCIDFLMVKLQLLWLKPTPPLVDLWSASGMTTDSGPSQRARYTWQSWTCCANHHTVWQWNLDTLPPTQQHNNNMSASAVVNSLRRGAISSVCTSLDRFHMRRLHCIIHITWQSTKSQTQQCLNSATWLALRPYADAHTVSLVRLRYPDAGRSHPPTSVLPTQQLGGQRKRYKDQFRVNLEACNFDYVSWKTVSVVRSQWRKRCSSAMKQFEEQRLEYIKSRRVYSARQTSLSRLFPLLVTTAALAVGHVLPISVSKTSSIDSSYRRLSPPSPMWLFCSVLLF